MTSSIKEPTVTDAPTPEMIEAGEIAHDQANRERKSFRERLAAAYTAMRSMEAKPDPEGLREALEYIAAHDATANGLTGFAFELVEQLTGAARDALSAKPSLEPTRTELVEGLIVAYMRHMAELRPADAHGLRVIASDIEAGFHRDPELNPLSRKQSGGEGGGNRWPACAIWTTS